MTLFLQILKFLVPALSAQATLHLNEHLAATLYGLILAGVSYATHRGWISLEHAAYIMADATLVLRLNINRTKAGEGPIVGVQLGAPPIEPLDRIK